MIPSNDSLSSLVYFDRNLSRPTSWSFCFTSGAETASAIAVSYLAQIGYGDFNSLPTHKENRVENNLFYLQHESTSTESTQNYC